MKNRALILLLAIVLAGCGPRLVYSHLDWLIPWYVSDYISLDSDQKNMLEKRVLKLLDWHCRTQLPAYATTLRALGRDLANISQPVDAATFQVYSTRLMALWKELLQQIGPDITAILATATDAQIDELFDNLDKQNQKFSSQLVPIAGDWIQNREIVQAEARRLLAHRHNNAGFRSAMQELIVNPESMRTAEYQRKIGINTAVTINLLFQLNQLLTEKQRSYLLDRIESLAADFDTLSCDPETLPKPNFN
jgi:hypothetical protein